MGSCTSNNDSLFDENRLTIWEKQFFALKLKKHEIIKLYKIYRKIDKDDSGFIEIDDLMVFINTIEISYALRVFSMFDVKGSGKINFHDFVFSVWNYCTLGIYSLDLFTFDLYDKDSKGFLSVEDFENMLEDLYEEKFQTNKQAKVIRKELTPYAEKQELNIELFKLFAKSHKTLLYPAFQIQRKLQKKIMGKKFWEYQSYKRIEISKGKFVPIGSFMEIHLDHTLHDQYLSAEIDRDGNRVSKTTKEIVRNTGTIHDRRENNNRI